MFSPFITPLSPAGSVAPPIRSLKVAVINCRSLLNKVPLLLLFIELHCRDILLLSETWLKPIDTCPYFHDVGFTIYRKDRLKLGGGTAILIRNNIASCLVDITFNDNVTSDVCCIDFHLWTHMFRIICVYRPLGLSVVIQTDAVSLVTCLSSLLISKNEFYIVSGDFNLPLINW